MHSGPDVLPASDATVLLRRGRVLEVITLGWNVAGIVVLAIAAIGARSVALAGFGLDSLIEIGASTVVLWELSGTGEDRQRRALRLIGAAFVALAAYLAVQSGLVLAAGPPGHSVVGIAWTAVTAAVMFALAAGKARTGKALGNPVLTTRAGHPGRRHPGGGGAGRAGPERRRRAVVGGSAGRAGHRGLCAARGQGDLPPAPHRTRKLTGKTGESRKPVACGPTTRLPPAPRSGPGDAPDLRSWRGPCPRPWRHGCGPKPARISPGQQADHIDLCVRVSPDRQRRAALLHASQVSPSAVLWRRPQLQGECEHLRWLATGGAE